jgi:hypothetical protein
MSKARELIKKLVALGVDPIDAAEVITEAMGAGAAMVVTDSAAEKRRAYDRERKAKMRNSTGFPVDSEADQFHRNSTGIPPEPRAHVRDITSTSENNHLIGDVVREAGNSDDWPEGDAHHHAALIVAEVGSPWLDPHKATALISTEGQIAAWRRDGASWRFDVLAVIRGAMARQRKPVNSWRWFNNAVAQSIADNRAALAIPEATVIPIRPGTGPPRETIADQIGAQDREIREAVLKMLENGSSR